MVVVADTDVAVAEAVVVVVEEVEVEVEVDTLAATMPLSAAADGEERSHVHRRQDFIFYDLIPYRLVDITISGRSGRSIESWHGMARQLCAGEPSWFQLNIGQTSSIDYAIQHV